MTIKVMPNKIREAKEYSKKHPYDTLQPGDRLFDKVYGNKIRKNEEKQEKAKREAEEIHSEQTERNNFRTKMYGGEWKRKYFT